MGSLTDGLPFCSACDLRVCGWVAASCVQRIRVCSGERAGVEFESLWRLLVHRGGLSRKRCNCVVVVGQSAGCGEPAVEGDVERVECLLPALGPVGPALSCRVQGHDRQVDALQRGLLVGKCPRALTALRIRALSGSIALVVQTIRRISRSNCRNGTNSAHAFSHNLVIAGCLAPQAPANYRNRSSAWSAVEAW